MVGRQFDLAFLFVSLPASIPALVTRDNRLEPFRFWLLGIWFFALSSLFFDPIGGYVNLRHLKLPARKSIVLGNIAFGCRPSF